MNFLEYVAFVLSTEAVAVLSWTFAVIGAVFAAFAAFDFLKTKRRFDSLQKLTDRVEAFTAEINKFSEDAIHKLDHEEVSQVPDTTKKEKRLVIMMLKDTSERLQRLQIDRRNEEEIHGILDEMTSIVSQLKEIEKKRSK